MHRNIFDGFNFGSAKINHQTANFSVYDVPQCTVYRIKTLGEFGELILIHQNFTCESFTVHMILSELKVWDSVNP